MGVPAGKCAVLYLSERGRVLAEKLAAGLPDCDIIAKNGQIKSLVAAVWPDYQQIICIMAAGIAVRSAAGLCVDKNHDPCLVVVDEAGKFAVSILSGHIGGGNKLAARAAAVLGGVPVITTASDVSGQTALDLWCRQHNFLYNSKLLLTKMSARLVERGRLELWLDMPNIGHLPDDLVRTGQPEQAEVMISHHHYPGRLTLHPQNIFLGIGCNRGTEAAEITECYLEFLQENKIKPDWIVGTATIDIKIDEPGLIEFARAHGFGLRYYHKHQLNGVAGVSTSAYVLGVTGAKGVAEPAAVLAAAKGGRAGELYIKKHKWPNVTMAAARQIIEFVL